MVLFMQAHINYAATLHKYQVLMCVCECFILLLFEHFYFPSFSGLLCNATGAVQYLQLKLCKIQMQLRPNFVANANTTSEWPTNVVAL